MTRCGEVGALAVGEQIERLGEDGGDVAEGGLGSFQVALGLLGLGGKAVLPRAQKIDGHRARVVGVEELLALLIHLRQSPPLASGLGFGLLAYPGECHLKLLLHEIGLLALDGDIAVGVLDRRLDQIDGHVGLLAAGALHSADAEEVGVAAAVALRLDQAHPRTAATAVEGALQVMVVLAVLLGGVVVGGEDRLGFVEARLVDQMLLSSLVFHSRVADDPHVVGVLEYQGELASREPAVETRR
ncbi:MAG TPA: hypothetical protein VFJ61_01500 [Solirubrobacterales bacterium]|nr:hypothetical protein [Solirubrobacterales bacterium]